MARDGCQGTSTAPAPSQPTHAIAARGTPKYPGNFTHFQAHNPHAPKGGVLKIACTGTFNSLNPFVPSAMAAQGLGLYSYLPFDSLMERAPDEPFSMYPRLARQVKLSPQADFITFYLDPRARFHDGTPVRAQDVVFTFNLMAKEGTIARRMMAQKVKEIRVDGPLTVTFVFHPSGEDGYDKELPLVIATLPILSEKQLASQNFAQTGLTPLMGSGPYRIGEVKVGERIEYVRDPAYWGKDLAALKGLYNFDRIVFDYYGSEPAAFEAFKKGDVTHWTESNINRWMNEYTFPAITHNKIVRETVHYTDAAVVRTLVFNTQKSPLQDPRVRQALSLLFDVDWMNKHFFHESLEPTSSFFGGTTFEAQGLPDQAEQALLKHSKDVPTDVLSKPLPTWPGKETPMRERIALAHGLLKEAGWSFHPKTQQWMKHGEVLTLEFLLNNPENERLALAYQRSLKQAGITLHIHTVDSAQYQRRLDERLFDLIFYTYGTGLSPGREQKLYWMSCFAKVQSRNYAGVQSPAIDQLCDLLCTAPTIEEIQTCMRMLDRLLRLGLYMRPLYGSNRGYYAYSRTLAHPPFDGKVRPSVYSWWAVP